jgi:hypothetical protein
MGSGMKRTQNVTTEDVGRHDYVKQHSFSQSGGAPGFFESSFSSAVEGLGMLAFCWLLLEAHCRRFKNAFNEGTGQKD